MKTAKEKRNRKKKFVIHFIFLHFSLNQILLCDILHLILSNHLGRFQIFSLSLFILNHDRFREAVFSTRRHTLSKKFDSRSLSTWIMDAEESESLCRVSLSFDSYRDTELHSKDRWINLCASWFSESRKFDSHILFSRASERVISYLPAKRLRIQHEYLVVFADKLRLIAQDILKPMGSMSRKVPFKLQSKVRK